MSIFRSNKKKVDKGFRKIDKIVTGLFLGSIIASVYGIKKHENDRRNEKKNEFFIIRPKESKGKKMTIKEIIKGLLFGIEHIKDDKKPGFVKSVYLFISHILNNGGKK